MFQLSVFQSFSIDSNGTPSYPLEVSFTHWKIELNTSIYPQGVPPCGPLDPHIHLHPVSSALNLKPYRYTHSRNPIDTHTLGIKIEILIVENVSFKNNNT